MRDINTYEPSTGRKIKEDGSLVNEVDILESQIGAKGAEFINDTQIHNAAKVYTSLQVITDATIASYTTDPNAAITGNTFTGVNLPMGTVIYGRFTSVKLTSGMIMAYKGV